MHKFAIGLAIAVMPSIAFAGVPSWRLSEASGDVRVLQSGVSRVAVRNALLASGSTLVTGPKGRAVIVRGEEFVVVSPNSQIRVAAEQNSGGLMQIIEDFGTSLFKIKKKATPHFGVQTPYLAAVVKGTTFTVTVGPEGGTVQVTEGAVEVSTLDGGAAHLITPGNIASVPASDLFELNVEGDVSKTIRSDNAPEPGTANPNPPKIASPTFPTSMRQPIEIAVSITENVRFLENVTDGLVQETILVERAMASASDRTLSPDTLAQAPSVDQSAQVSGNSDGGAVGSGGTAGTNSPSGTVSVSSDAGSASAAADVSSSTATDGTGTDGASAAVDAGASVATGGASAAADVGGSVDTGGVSATADAGATVDTGGATATADVGGTVDTSGATATADVGGSVDTGGATATADAGGSVDSGGVSATADVGGSVDTGGVSATADVGGTVDTGGATATADVGGSVDLGGSDGASAAVDVGAAVDAGGVVDVGATADAGGIDADVGLDAGAGGSGDLGGAVGGVGGAVGGLL